MKKHNMKKLLAAVITVGVIAVPVAYAGTWAGGYISGDKPVSTTSGMQRMFAGGDRYYNAQTSGTLDESERQSLLYMVEEEKLARDIYLTLYDKWQEPLFKTIATSEERHMEAIQNILDRYGVDYSLSDSIGVFENSELQQLYNTLVQQGESSVEDALKVGALVEETDIADLQKAINETDKKDIQRVYTNLMNGSFHHLKAFTSTLEQYGITYTPQVLSQDEYNDIIDMPMGHYGQNGGSHGKGHRGGHRGQGHRGGMNGGMQKGWNGTSPHMNMGWEN